ncbi:MAG: hypothetical protein KF857_12970 [Fimbriimonadaceae bacterium]|nr:hypothetical protein [Fimbriimonadaceae bacterium]
MNNSFYQKLVDMYAGNELTEELVAEMDAAATADPDLRHDMASLSLTVDVLRSLPGPELTDVCTQRILRRILDGADIPAEIADPAAIRQYRLFR